MQKSYRLVTILKTDEKELVKKLKSILEGAGVVDLSEEVLGKKDFTYPIKKLDSGYYFQHRFTAEPTVVKVIINKIKLEESILRYLLTAEEVKATAGKTK